MISSQFLQNCQSGDPEAVETLVRTHQRAVFQLALSVLDDLPGKGAGGSGISAEAVAEAEAATRETFVAALNKLGRYREDTPFETWLYRIAIQVSRKRYRGWRIRRWVAGLLGRRPIYSLDDAQASDPRFLAGDADLWMAVRGLPEPLRLAVVLRYYHDLPIDQIARLLNLSEGAVHARLDSAREKIAGVLERQ